MGWGIYFRNITKPMQNLTFVRKRNIRKSERLDMLRWTTIRVGLRTTATGAKLALFKASMLDMDLIKTDDDVIDYARRSIQSGWGDRALLLNCIDNLDYSIEREVR
jgi:hypothetical protein